MAIVTLEDMKDNLGLTPDQDADDTLIEGKIAAAQNHIERMLGFVIEERFGGVDQPEIPTAIREAVMQLATWWFENREAATDLTRELPFGVRDIVDGFREWTF
ncbi:head-tail connector protein [Paracoccus versutus]|uniref:Gp6-like head-tail connector protein n=1 Tax=Paracoccus versutus TaxID=34007 RepID=A0A3D9XA30_PARVE|nr:head-tail connector protein [Paracoccus versutus]REF67395.1 gp6-like head-tail connector protein [Paracoccus versutus]WGR58645.1 phage gp6-like head-tail connector protein [Paracoccus versutus]